MTDAGEMLTREIMQLRQFFRAAMNDQLFGDEIAWAALSLIDLDEIAALPEDDRRSRLFCDALSAWTAAAGTERKNNFSGSDLLASTRPVASPGELMLILTEVMGLAHRDAASALHLSLADAMDLAKSARAGLEQRITGRVLIIEDEPLIAEGVAMLVESLGAEVVAMARSLDQAIALAARHRPDVVLADFDLGGGGTGLDAVKQITSEMPAVAIFITAFPDEVLTGEDYEPTFVLAKPYRERALKTALAYSLKAPRAELVE
ncbi:MAG: response regulator [Rhodospirillales bacterium]